MVPVKTLADGALDLADLRAKAEKHKDNLAAFMVRPFLLLCSSGVSTDWGDDEICRLRIRRHLVYLKMVLKRFVGFSPLLQSATRANDVLGV